MKLLVILALSSVIFFGETLRTSHLQGTNGPILGVPLPNTTPQNSSTSSALNSTGFFSIDGSWEVSRLGSSPLSNTSSSMGLPAWTQVQIKLDDLKQNISARINATGVFSNEELSQDDYDGWGAQGGQRGGEWGQQQPSGSRFAFMTIPYTYQAPVGNNSSNSSTGQ
jgi:hypothetical protein